MSCPRYVKFDFSAALRYPVCYSVEARLPSVVGSAIPAVPEDPGQRGIAAEIARFRSETGGWCVWAKSQPLSFVSERSKNTDGALPGSEAGFSLHPRSIPQKISAMNVFELTRTLIDIESITDNEANVGNYLFDHLSQLAARHQGTVERIEVEPSRFNVLACFGNPTVTLSTHLDTVPPFFASREDVDFIWGRGACDVKGIIASMIGAAEILLAAGVRNFALLFVVGEERNSAGALARNHFH